MSTTHLAGLAAIDITDVHPSPNNPRERLDDLDDLALSIRENGLIQPLVVQNIPGHPGYQVVAGHRRLAAVKNLGWVKVPCIIRKDMLPDEELLAMLVENGQRANLDPIEEARALRRLKSAGMADADIARRVGRSKHTVAARLALLSLPLEEQEQLRAGASTLTRAAELLRQERRILRERQRPEARPVGRPKGVKTRPHFGDTHPLADVVRALCDHRGRPKVGKTGCGPCWEQAIRDDATVHATDLEQAS